MSYEARLTRLEQAITPESLVITIRRFGEGELQGFSCSDPGVPYFKRRPGEAERTFRDRAVDAASALGGIVVLGEERSAGAAAD